MKIWKFKALDINTRKPVYGSLVTRKKEGKTTYQIENADFNNFAVWDVDKKTISAFTGLQDVNGKDIYENDVIEFTANYTSKKCGVLSGIIFFDNYGLIIKVGEDVYDVREETDEIYCKTKILGTILK